MCIIWLGHMSGRVGLGMGKGRFTAGLVLPRELEDRDQPTAPHVRRILKSSAAYIKVKIRKVGDLTST